MKIRKNVGRGHRRHLLLAGTLFFAQEFFSRCSVPWGIVLPPPPFLLLLHSWRHIFQWLLRQIGQERNKELFNWTKHSTGSSGRLRSLPVLCGNFIWPPGISRIIHNYICRRWCFCCQSFSNDCIRDQQLSMLLLWRRRTNEAFWDRNDGRQKWTGEESGNWFSCRNTVGKTLPPTDVHSDALFVLGPKPTYPSETSYSSSTGIV